MRIAIRIALGLALLLTLALGALALLLPRLVRGPAVRARIEEVARSATGREFRYRDLEVRLLPPRLVMIEPSLAGESPGDPPFAEARTLALELALLPLLARAVVVDSLQVEGATVRLVRDEEGIRFPRPEKKPREPREEKEPDAERDRERGGPRFELAVREVEVEGARVVLEDRAVAQPVTWDLQDVEVRTRATSPTKPIAFTLAARLASGGSVRGEGTATLDRDVEARFDLEEVELGPLTSYLGKGQSVSGGVTGKVELTGKAGPPDRLAAHLVLGKGVVDVSEVRAEGRLQLEIELQGPPFAGPFKLDATQAELRAGSSSYFQKPAGTPATAEGRIVPREDGRYDVDDVRVVIQNLDTQGRVETGERTRARLSAPPFELAGWEKLLPSLAGRPLSGRLALRDLALATAPLELGGRIELDRVRLGSPRSPPLELRGALVGKGASLASEGLVLDVAGQALRLSLSVSDLAASPDLRLAAAGQGLDAGALAHALAGSQALDGRGALDLDVAAPLKGEAALLERVAGRVRIEVAPGHLRGVSLLRQASDGLGAVAATALLANRLRGSRKAERYYEDEFQSLSGTFQLARGRARTQDLRLVYRHYTVSLRGQIGLADAALDLTGEIRADPEVDAELAGGEGTGRPVVIPLAHVVGTATSPRVDLSPRAVTLLAGRYALARKRGRLEEKLDEKLGPGAGAAVDDVLEGILGGGGRKQ